MFGRSPPVLEIPTFARVAARSHGRVVALVDAVPHRPLVDRSTG
jgi:hypothetical protein